MNITKSTLQCSVRQSLGLSVVSHHLHARSCQCLHHLGVRILHQPVVELHNLHVVSSGDSLIRAVPPSNVLLSHDGGGEP